MLDLAERDALTVKQVANRMKDGTVHDVLR
jgi:hypothetical protein